MLDKEFKELFFKKELMHTYEDHVRFSNAIGLDNISQKHFSLIKHEQVEIINRKILANTYNFTKYKLKLISKGRGKIPREISIPTIRDRVVLRVLCNFLINNFKDDVGLTLPQTIIYNIKETIKTEEINSFVKFDIKNFYPSIPHNKLDKLLHQKIKNKNICKLIKQAISTPTVPKVFQKNKILEENDKGIPQGLSISNILANLYISHIDKKFRKNKNIYFFRYVDDIIILSKEKNINNILEIKEIEEDFKKSCLELYDPNSSSDKSQKGHIGEKFNYLGYQFENHIITVRSSSFYKLQESLISIFTSYKYSKNKNIKFLEWRLNLRITGCIFERKTKGWLFFFSEINDEMLLHRLDNYIIKLIKRFQVDIQPKKFVRSFYQIKHKKYESTYIPNFDEYSIEQMKKILEEYFNKKVFSMSNDTIQYEFNKRINKQAKDLLTDVQDFGY